MRVTFILIAVIVGNFAYGSAVSASSSQSDCPTIMVEGPKDVDGSKLVFKVKVTGGKLKSESLTYKWTVEGGEITAGQGTSTVTVTNFDLRKKSVTVVVEVEGLPLKCANSASCTLSS